MRVIGHRKEQSIVFSASAELLVEGALFNDEMHRLPTGNTTFIPKGVYRFHSIEEANRQWEACLVEGMAKTALARE